MQLEYTEDWKLWHQMLTISQTTGQNFGVIIWPIQQEDHFMVFKPNSDDHVAVPTAKFIEFVTPPEANNATTDSAETTV